MFAQFSITNATSSLTNNFNSYNPSSSGNLTSTVNSTNVLTAITGTGWTASSSGTANYGGQTPSTTSGGYWGFGSAGNFGLGGLRSGTPGNITYTVSFVNNSGGTITSITLAWDYKQHSYVNTSGWNVTGTGQLAGNATLNGKDFNGAASGSGITTTAVSSFTLSGLSIANGQSFGMSWLTTDQTGADNCVSIDNFSISTSGSTPVPVVSGGSTSGTVGTAFSYDLSTLATNSPTSFSITGGSLPPGLSLNTSTGDITGTPTTAGSYSINFNASNAGGPSTSSATLNITIGKGTQTITFNTLASVPYGTAPGTLSASSNSGLTVSFSSGTPAVASVSGTTITYGNVGSSNITATQAGNANWNAASAVVRSQVVTTKALTVTGLTGVSKAYDGTTPTTATGTATLNGVLAGDVGNVTLSGTPAFNFTTATVGTSKPITVTGYTLAGSAAGNYSITQPAGLTANVTSITVTVSGAVANDKVYNGTTAATISGATVNGVLPADVANAVVTTGTFASANVGTNIAVTAILSGSAAGNYTLTQPGGLSADITKANQTITFNTLADKTTASAPFALTATASSGLAVTYSSSNTGVATVSGSTVTIQGAGTTTITAMQAGNANYNAASNVTQSQLVTNPPGPLADYLFTGSPGALTPSNTAANVTFSNISANTISQNSNVSNVFTGAPSSGTWGTAFSATRYIQFTITPAAGYLLNATSFDMDIFRSSAGATSYAIRSSVDNYAADLTTGSVTTSQTAIPNLGLSSLSFNNLSTVTFRVYGWGGNSTGDLRIDNITVNGNLVSSCTTPVDLVFQTQPVTSNQDAIIPVSVKAVCSNGTVASGLNTGSVTLALNAGACGLEQSGSHVTTVTANFVNGVATFSNLSFSRSTQTAVKFTTTNTQGLTNVTSSSFNINAPVGGTPTITTIVNETFESTSQWGYVVGTPTYTGSGGGGTDVVSVKTFSSNKSLCKSYSTNNSASEKRSTNTITFDNQNIATYTYATFSFQLASLGSGSGAGVDGSDDLKIEVSLNNGSSWSTLLTYYGDNDYTFNYSTSPVTALNYNANAQYTSGTKSAFSVQLPNGTTQFKFRVTATSNRTNENWAIDNVKLVGTTYPVGAQLELPTATGGTIATCPNTNNTLSVVTDNTVGTITYSWSPTTNMTPSGTVANPTVNPATGTTYTVTITDADGCKATATQIITVPTGTAGVWTGNENNDWFQCLNWGNGVVPTSTTNVTIPNGTLNDAIIDPNSSFAAPFSGIANANNISINMGAQLLSEYGGYLVIDGHWDNDGTFNPGDGTVIFNGTGTSTIDGTATQQFNNLIIDTDVQLLQDASTGGLGTLAVNQKFDLNQHTFTVSNPINTAITRTTPGYVLSETQNGAARLLWQMDDFSYADNYVFPMGNSSGDYLPVTFKLNSGFIGLAGVSTYNSAAAAVWPTGTENVTSVANPSKAVQRFWHLQSDQPANSYNADVTFSFPGSEDPTIGLGPDVKFQRYNKPSDSWDAPLATQTYSFASTRTVQVQGITKFSWWGGGNDNTNPLPIELLTFTAKPNGEIVALNWATATETNNDYFTVERSSDAINFEPVAVVAGAGNSNTMLSYNTSDEQPLSGLSYYRLKQTDFNGDFSYSQIVPVQFKTDGFAVVRSFVNAANQIELWLNNDSDEDATITIYDTQGKILYAIKQPVTKGSNRISYAIDGLAGAIYFVRIQTPTKSASVKIVNQGR